MLEDDVMPRVDQQLCFALYATLHAAHKVYAPFLRSIGLTYPQYLVMLVLWEADDMTVKAIGERLHLNSGTLTPLLKRLEANGLLGRARDPKDERQVRVKLTEKGHDLRRQARPFRRRWRAAMGRSPDDLKGVRKELRRIRNALLGSRKRQAGKARQDRKQTVDSAHGSGLSKNSAGLPPLQHARHDLRGIIDHRHDARVIQPRRPDDAEHAHDVLLLVVERRRDHRRSGQ